jgi:hypothetical protein
LQPIRNRRELLDDSEVSKRFTWGGPHSVALSIERRSLRRTPACYQCAASHDSRCAAPQHRPARQRARQVSREPMRPQQMQQSWSNKCLPVPDIEGIPHVSDPHSWAESATSSRRTRSKSQERPKPARNRTFARNASSSPDHSWSRQPRARTTCSVHAIAATTLGWRDAPVA